MVLHSASALPVTGRRFSQCIKCLHSMRERSLNFKRLSAKVFFFRYHISLLVFIENILLYYKDGKKHPFLSFRTILVLSNIFFGFISTSESVACQFHIKLITAGTNHSCPSQLQYNSVIPWNLERVLYSFYWLVLVFWHCRTIKKKRKSSKTRSAVLLA